MPEDHHGGRASLTLDCDLAALERLREFVEAFCERAALPEEVSYHASIVLEELAINSVKHGRCHPREEAIRIELRLEPGRLSIAYSDTGVPFDPLAAPVPDLGLAIAHRPIGGLGVHLVRCLMPEIRYERRDGRNCLYLVKPIETTAEPIRPTGGSDANRHGNCPR